MGIRTRRRPALAAAPLAALGLSLSITLAPSPAVVAEILPGGSAFFEASLFGADAAPAGATGLPDSNFFFDIDLDLVSGPIGLQGNTHAQGDPHYVFDMTFTNNDNTMPNTAFFGMSFDMMEIFPAGATMQFTVDVTPMDLSGDGDVSITPLGPPMANMFLSDDRTNFLTTPETSFMPMAPLIVDGVTTMFDSGLLPVPDIPFFYNTLSHNVMGFQSAFGISRGDAVNITGRFDIFPAAGVIPTPTALPAGLALLGLLGLKRKRRPA